MSERSDELTKRSAAVLTWLRQREDEIGALLADIVSIATENPPGKNLRACADILESHVRQMGLPCERVGPRNSKNKTEDPGECFVATHGNGSPALYFHGHYDVVPAQHDQQFHPRRQEHFLFGRGSADMKGGIVAMLYAIDALKHMGSELQGRIVLTLVPDEETGGANGSAWLARQGLLGRDAVGMLLAEPTSGVIWNANRGAISLRIRVFGKPAHVGLQHQGENAFERMTLVVERLQQLKREVEQHSTSANIGSEQARNSILMLGGQSGGGTNFNVVPEQCWFTVDRRINPEEDLAAEKAKLLNVLERCKSDGIPMDWEIFQEGSPAFCDEQKPIGKALSRSVEIVTGKTPRVEMCPGLLDIRFYAAQRIPAYAYGPGLLSVSHGPNEFVDLRRIVDTAAIYALTAIESLSS